MAGNTHLDALVAEMLGDIGKLHDELRSLKDETLPAVVTDAEQKLAGVVGTLLKAGQQYQAAIQEVTNKTVASAKADIRTGAMQAKDDAVGEVRQQVREAVAQPIGDLVGKLNGAVNRTEAQAGATWKKAIIAALVGGIVSGLIVLGGAYALLKPQAQATADQVDESPAAKPTKKGNKQ